MATMTFQSEYDATFDQDFVPEESVRGKIMSLLARLYPQGEVVERRNEQRYPFPYLVHLTPLSDNGMARETETVVVVGKHLSERGLGFYHPKPLPHRRMVASIEAGNGSWLGFVIDLSWCRFTKQGWYESGGRLIQSVPSPVDGAA